MVKPASENCNLNCSYCFYHSRPEDPYASEAAARRMSDDSMQGQDPTPPA